MHRYLGGKPRQRVADAHGAGIPQPHGVGPVGVKCWPDIPAVRTVGRPGGAFAGFNMYYYLVPRRECMGWPRGCD
jgi:hypothetical protein